MTTLQTQTLDDIIPNYKVFLFDIWGVLHNGVHALPGAPELVDRLHADNKIVIAVSNSMRSGEYLSEVFAKMGISIAPEFIFSSGNTCRQYLADHKGTIFRIGKDYNGDLLEGLDIEEVEDVKQAGSILLTTYIYDENLAVYDDLLREAVAHGAVALCPNPDIMAMHGEKYHYCPGAIAKRYEEMGGKAIYFGKPYSPIYESAYAQARELIPGLQKSDVLMFGDTLETDIGGAQKMGFDTALLLTGNAAREGVEEFTEIVPTWVLTGFSM